MKNSNVIFSIIVPVYNTEAYLEKCITSVLSQTFESFELILVDDGSTDGSALICDYYQSMDERIRVIHKHNGGQVSARKVGINLAKGEYAVCIDSDDWIDKNHLLELSNVIEAYSPDVICFNFYEVNEGVQCLRNIPYRSGEYSKENLIQEIYPNLIQNSDGSYFPPSLWNKAFKIDIYRTEQQNVDDRITIGEDVACIIPCILNANSMFILDKSLYYYRRNNNSITKVRKPFSWDLPELIEVHLRNRIDTSDTDIQQQIIRRTAHAMMSLVITQFYREEKYSIIKKEIIKELRRPIYWHALKESRFKRGSRSAICRLFLNHNIIFPFYILSKVK